MRQVGRGFSVSTTWVSTHTPIVVKEVYNQNRSKGIKLPKGRFTISFETIHQVGNFNISMLPDLNEVLIYRGKLVRVVKIGCPDFITDLIERIRNSEPRPEDD